MKIERIPAGIYQANCYAVMDENKKGILIDPSGDAPLIMKKIKEMDMDLKAILLTHGHGDHIGAIDEILDKFNVPIYAHKNEKELLLNPMMNLSTTMTHGPYKIEADIYFDEGVLENEIFPIEVIHTPGHTSGSVCFKIKDNLFTGDTLFPGSIGRTDLATANPFEMNKSLQKIKKLDENLKVFPGHGPMTTLANEFKNNPFLR